jgi:hypothetical protein
VNEKTPAAMLESIVGICAKVFADNEEHECVFVVDLAELRDEINDLRRAVATGAGYKSVPKLVRPEKG